MMQLRLPRRRRAINYSPAGVGRSSAGQLAPWGVGLSRQTTRVRGRPTLFWRRCTYAACRLPGANREGSGRLICRRERGRVTVAGSRCCPSSTNDRQRSALRTQQGSVTRNRLSLGCVLHCLPQHRPAQYQWTWDSVLCAMAVPAPFQKRQSSGSFAGWAAYRNAWWC